jgi:hydroxymethylpyrimidine/phosphomethylpyrimidine kinase
MKVLNELRKAVKKLVKERKFIFLIPEVRSNFVFAKKNFRNIKDVAGVEGRITIVDKRPFFSGKIKFGASDHLARLLLAIKSYAPEYRSAINFKFDSRIFKAVKIAAKKEKIRIGAINRKLEPKRIQKEEGMSIPWKVKYLYKKYKKIPQIFYETAGWGKEPLFVVLGRRPEEIVLIIKEILKNL